MPGVLYHSPSFITQKLIIQLGLGMQPGSGATWPVYVGNEPTSPDNVITCKGTTGRDNGRTMYDGERQGMEGVQIRVRAVNEQTGWIKSNNIAQKLSKDVLRREVAFDNHTYIVQAVTVASGPIPIGEEEGSSRYIHTTNILISVRESAVPANAYTNFAGQPYTNFAGQVYTGA